MDRTDPFDEGPVRRPLEDEVGRGDPALAEGVGQDEDLDPSQNAEALKQDPDAVPNRTQEPEPPREEEVKAKG